jgi:hypothetical protein
MRSTASNPLLDNFLFLGKSLTMRFGFVQLRFSPVEGPTDKSSAANHSNLSEFFLLLVTKPLHPIL